MQDLNRPQPHTRPMPFWFWNGLLDPAELCAQMARMRQVGIDELIIHARYGLKTPYMSEAWMAAVQAVVEDAARTGMHVWIYDEYNWPSGTCGGVIPRGNVNFREHYLDDAGQIRPLDGIKGAADPGRNVDYLNPAATDEFIRLCYEPYYQRLGKHFGSAIRGFFNDEVRFFHARPWSTSVAEPPPAGGEYFQRLGELMTTNTFARIAGWCEARDVQFIGHVMGEETLASQVRYVADPFSTINAFHHPGIDHLGTAAEGLHPRLAASVAHLNGNRPVTSETFAGNPWDFTVTDLYRISGWLYASGITRMILHGFYYQREGDAAGDWPPDIFYRWKHWGEIEPYLTWAGRVQAFLAAATPTCRVALYVPLREFWDSYRPDTQFTLDYNEGAHVEDEQARRLHLAVGQLGAELVRRGIDFDFCPPQWLDRVAGRVLVVPAGVQVGFSGTKISQGSLSAAECADAVDRALGRRVRVTGPNAQPDPLPVSEYLSDPYLHMKRDEGGVHVRSFVYEGRSAHLLWNANPTTFRGRVDLVERRPWTLWRPDTGEQGELGLRDSAEVDLPAYRMAVIK